MDELRVHLNGKIVPAAEAALSIWDAGFLHGASVFTTMLAHKGVVFHLDRHLARLMETARLVHLRTDATAEALLAATKELLAANALTEAQVRITLTPGSIRSGEPTTLITVAELPRYPGEWYEKGITVTVSPFKQTATDPIYGHKTGAYFSRMLARQDAAEKGAEEALWYTVDNYLAEACFCNVFLVLDDSVHTPPLRTPVLPGIVRQAVIELCGQLGIACDDQASLSVRDMLTAGEIFLTASCSGIRPVVRVERHAVGDEKPGRTTRRIMAAYQELLDRECAS